MARIKFLPSIDILMCFKVARSREELVAVRARVRFLPCVDPLMFFKVVCIRERLVTETIYSFFHPIIVVFNSTARGLPQTPCEP